MIRTRTLLALSSGLIVSALALAAPAGAPAGSTGQCKDGSYYSGATKSGACSGHKGVKEWWGPAAGTTAAATPAPATAKPVTPAAAPTPPVSAPAPAPAATTSAPSKFTPPATAAPGGGPGTVWANAGTKVYHCPSDKWYGKTKQGEYMTEAAAQAKGFHPDHGKACNK